MSLLTPVYRHEDAWTCPPAAVQCRFLAAYTSSGSSSGLRRDIISHSISAMFHSGLVARLRKMIVCMLNNPPQRTLTVIKRLTKTNVWFCGKFTTSLLINLKHFSSWITTWQEDKGIQRWPRDDAAVRNSAVLWKLYNTFAIFIPRFTLTGSSSSWLGSSYRKIVQDRLRSSCLQRNHYKG